MRKIILAALFVLFAAGIILADGAGSIITNPIPGVAYPCTGVAGFIGPTGIIPSASITGWTITADQQGSFSCGILRNDQSICTAALNNAINSSGSITPVAVLPVDVIKIQVLTATGVGRVQVMLVTGPPLPVGAVGATGTTGDKGTTGVTGTTAVTGQ
jgi:hypothetical protein